MRVFVHRLDGPDAVALSRHGRRHVGEVRTGGRRHWDWIVEGIESRHRDRHGTELLNRGGGKIQHEAVNRRLCAHRHVPHALNAVHGVGERVVTRTSCEVIVRRFIGGVDVWCRGTSFGPKHVLREGVSVGVEAGDADAGVVTSRQHITGLWRLQSDRHTVPNHEVDATNDGGPGIGQSGHADGVVAHKGRIPHQSSSAQRITDVGGRPGFVVDGPREPVG